MKIDYLSYLFQYVLYTSKKYNIDESHSLKHSMDVYNYANKIYETELPNNKYLIQHKNIIDTSAILHDMCDKKYMDQSEGAQNIKKYLEEYKPTILDNSEINCVVDIMSYMSYSTVKKFGFPNLGHYQLAYNIVREADLLASYDVDRCIMYKMYVDHSNYKDAVYDALNVFENRMFRYHKDNLFTTKYALQQSYILKKYAIKNINAIKKILL